MPNSYRIRTEVGTNKTIQVNLDQDFDKLEILSLSIFPNDVYTRSCADFGVVCGRVFANRGLGLVNARVSIFIPISEEDESNPIISTLYPYKSFEDFNEDGYKYNLLPYSQSYSGHVPVGTFPDRLDALTNPSVIEVYDKYYKFTAKTNDAGDFMIFGVPIGQYQIFMQVDLSDIGEFSLAPQDLIRMGRAVESQVNGTKFKFSENYSELPQIVTLTKTIQVAPFYGEEGVCQHYIVRADFDLTSEASIELKPTAVFMGSLISTSNKKKLKRNCKVPSKQGWLCDLIAGPGQIDTIRQTIFTDDDGRPILEEFRLENDGKVIDENGAWVVEIPMNLDYQYTDENGIRRISPDGSVGVPVRSRYRFKIKWQQSTSLSEENRRGYFLVPNIKEWGWTQSDTDTYDPAKNPPSEGSITLNDDDGVENISSFTQYYIVTGADNVSEWTVSVNGVVRPDLKYTIPMPLLSGPGQLIEINFTRVDSNVNGFLLVDVYSEEEFQAQCSYAYSLSWADYGTTEMIQEAIDCEDRFFEFSYNKVYTVSQLIDRFSSSFVPQKSIQIKYVNDDKCEGEKNPFPVNDAYYRYDILFILFSFIIGLFKFIFIPLTIILHVLALLWPILLAIILVFIVILNIIIVICNLINRIVAGIAAIFDAGENLGSCPEYIPINFSQLRINPFKNIQLPLFLYTEDGCVRCRCNISDLDLDEENNSIAVALIDNAEQYNEINVSNLANLTTLNEYTPQEALLYGVGGGAENYKLGGTCGTMEFATHSDETGGEGGVTNDPLNIAKILQSGWNSDEKLSWIRLPIFEGNDGSTNFQRFSLGLTIAERLNLFNTKAKYFDNVTNFWGGTANPNSKDESISPGNYGWNQVKVTWNPTNNNPDTKYHFDNVLVLVYDSGTFNQGDIVTFQDPAESQDPNVNDTLGVFTRHLQRTVTYANPDFEGPPVSTTTYTMPIAGANSITGTTCFPMDIEYFQVIQTISYDEYILATSMTAGGAGGSNISYAQQISNNQSQISYDARFSLPYRFLRTNAGQYRYWGTCNGCDGIPANAGPLNYPISNYCSSANLSNASRVYTRRFGNGTDCVPRCFDHLTFTSYHADDWSSLNTSNLRIMFLQRGVDPNSQTIPVRYDLRRLFGSTTSWSSNNIGKAGITSQQFNNPFVNQYIIFTAPAMKMNIPIQGSSTDVNNPKGLRLPYHEFFLNNDPSGVPANSLPLFYQSYNFQYIDTVDIPFFTFPSTMATYYSALSKYSRFLHGQWNPGVTVSSGVIDETTQFFNGGLYDGILCVDPFNNGFAKNLVREIRIEDTYQCYLNSTSVIQQRYPFVIPSAYTVLPQYNSNGNWILGVQVVEACGNGNSDGSSLFEANCYDGPNSVYQSPYNGAGTGRYCNIYGGYGDQNVYYHTLRRNVETNDTSGYFGREYVEGSSVFLGKLITHWDYQASVFRGCPLGYFVSNADDDLWVLPQQNPLDFDYASTYQQVGVNPWNYNLLRQRDHYFTEQTATYFSPVYAGFPSDVPVDVAGGYNAQTWHVDPNHTIQITNKNYNVFRTDRLPSSKQVTNNGYNNTMLLHQNAGFAIFKLSGCDITQVGGGDVDLETISVEVDTEFIPGGADGPLADVLLSVSQCDRAVDLNSYYVTPSGAPGIHPPIPYSENPAAGADYLWFERGTGCYNLVSKPFVSLFGFSLPDVTPLGGGETYTPKYSDIRSVVEWTQRLKLTFALCFDIFSQTFSNNWINGTLYAFSFQMATFFDSDNQPYKDYCRDTIFFNRQIRNFFYRSSPYDGTNFVGKLKYDLSDPSVNKYGNLKNLLFPTTIMDLGPKNEFIQELVFSNDYDGYIVNKVPITSYQDVSNVSNMFVLSRFINASFWQLLFPVGNVDDNGNEQGSDDPAIGALFKNSRWQNGELFASGFLPGIVDADYSQMLSINSEFGVKEFGPELYGNNTIYFGTDGTGIPIFGLYYSANTQDRDYISPRRTVYDPGATLPFTSANTDSILTFTQTVPFYQWEINMVNGVVPNLPVSNTIFGQQSNNFVTNPGTSFYNYEYQDLDRTTSASDYFRPSSSINTAQYYNGFISNFDSSGNFIPDSPVPLGNRRYTFGAPQHFYFGLIQGGSAMDVFIFKYVDTTLVND